MERQTCYVIIAMGIFAILCAPTVLGVTAVIGGGRGISMGMTAVPCGLLGCVTCLIVSVLRSYEKRIARLERRLQQTDRADK